MLVGFFCKNNRSIFMQGKIFNINVCHPQCALQCSGSMYPNLRACACPKGMCPDGVDNVNPLWYYRLYPEACALRVCILVLCDMIVCTMVVCRCVS